MSTVFTAKQAKNVQEILDIVTVAQKEGCTKNEAFRLLKPALNIYTGWDVEKKSDEQNLRLQLFSVKSALLVWWRFTRTKSQNSISAETVWNIAALLDGIDEGEPRGAVEAAPPAKPAKATKKPKKSAKPAPKVTAAMEAALKRMAAGGAK